MLIITPVTINDNDIDHITALALQPCVYLALLASTFICPASTIHQCFAFNQSAPCITASQFCRSDPRFFLSSFTSTPHFRLSLLSYIIVSLKSVKIKSHICSFGKHEAHR